VALRMPTGSLTDRARVWAQCDAAYRVISSMCTELVATDQSDNLAVVEVALACNAAVCRANTHTGGQGNDSGLGQAQAMLERVAMRHLNTPAAALCYDLAVLRAHLCLSSGAFEVAANIAAWAVAARAPGNPWAAQNALGVSLALLGEQWAKQDERKGIFARSVAALQAALEACRPCDRGSVQANLAHAQLLALRPPTPGATGGKRKRAMNPEYAKGEATASGGAGGKSSSTRNKRKKTE
jgi:hypothetical protein